MIINPVPKKIKTFIFLFSCLSIIFMLLLKNNGIYITQTTLIIYSISIIGLFFINLMVFIFLLLYYVSNQRESYLLILSLAFLSNMCYLLEVAMILLSSVGNGLSALYQTSNNIAIYYFFRQLSFISLIFLAIYSTNTKNKNIFTEKRNVIIILLSILILLVTPLIAKNLSSDNVKYGLSIVQHSLKRDLSTWDIMYTKIISIFWLALLITSCISIRNYSKIWFCIILICTASVLNNLILLYFINKPYPAWYITKCLELISMVYIISTLMYYVFRELNYANHMAIHDPLTNTYNRRYFIDSLMNISKHYSFSVIMLDIDNFKSINDKWGHHMGDQVIAMVTKIIKKSIREEDVLGRLGGEEFGIIIKGNSQKLLLLIAERIRKNIEEQCSKKLFSHGPERVTVSIGCFTSKENNLSPSEMLVNADKALYQAKRTGKNKVIINSK
ncbi:sensor domain-containing diguanylate cyclase [Escherichia coli]|uniref:sensor domain-containing diguanylate cyclase n=1 Tax=Escherichia coli TaxID=562 RepID=UPI001C4079D1|nr:sensor domain-containing diguanylate cyclase [Escherichia coli]